jgi:Icc-related predicted phosphoesterase
VIFKKQTTTRLFFATDLHGSERLFRKFLNAAKVYSVPILILGGDITGKALVPCVHQGGKYTCQLMGREYTASTQAELDELYRLINYNGFYPRTMEPDEVACLQNDPVYHDQIFQETLLSSVKSWLEVAQEKLKGTSVFLYMMPGNDDPPQVIQLLTESQVAIYCEGCCVQLDETHEMISMGYSNPTPWHTERELPEDALMEKLEAMAPLVKAPQNLVVNFHAPPYDSRLDTAPELKEGFQINTQMGQPVLVPVGSKSVRAYIEKHQPLLGLHGHVHESDGMSRIGRTLCINPGSAYTDGMLCGAIVGLKKDGLDTYQMVRG